ncbi:hypothetical protein LT493_40170 [Streptomyces tricolor]|nr:hypothetical protein [Streptomyces tricolor]
MAMVGLIAGMALGFAGYFGGFGAFLLVAALGAVGLSSAGSRTATSNPVTSSAPRDSRRERGR